jgi:hypothetical protein
VTFCDPYGCVCESFGWDGVILNHQQMLGVTVVVEATPVVSPRVWWFR